MGLIGRNETCYCGSGKKYKKCCLQLDEQKLQQWILPKPPGDSFKLAKTIHDIKKGLKELALAQKEHIIIWLSKEHIQDNLIKVNSQESGII